MQYLNAALKRLEAEKRVAELEEILQDVETIEKEYNTEEVIVLKKRLMRKIAIAKEEMLLYRKAEENYVNHPDYSCVPFETAMR